MKLSFKKKSGGGDKKGKRKSSGGGGGLAGAKTFFADHIEKLLLGAIGLVTVMLVFSGLRKERLQTGPEEVGAVISQAESRIDSPTWADVKLQRAPENDTFEERATADTIPVDLASYQPVVPFHTRLQERNKQRSDPELLAPIDLEVKSGYGGLAVKEQSSSLGAVIDQQNSRKGRTWDRARRRGSVSLGGQYVSRFFVALTGLVPYKQQFDRYADAFQGAAEYAAERDVPRYIYLDVQRAEIQPDGSVGAWQDLDAEKAMLEEPELVWDGRTEEIADAKHLIKTLTMPIPPLVMRDLSQWAVHSKVPVEDTNRARGRRGEMEREQERMKTRGRRGRSSEEEQELEMADDDLLAKPELEVENGMLRFFDLTAEPGKAYQYRVRARLDDANDPMEEGLNRPSANACETSVLIRLQSKSNSYLATPWSEPSPTIRVPRGSALLAAEVRSPKTVSVGPDRRIQIPRRPFDEPSVQIMTLSWDAERTRDVPIVMNVGRGSILNGTATEIEAKDPTSAKILEIETYNYETDAFVLDIYGGYSIGNDLTAPGAALVFKDGKVELRTQVNDRAAYLENEIPPDEDKREEEAMAPEEGTDEQPRRGRGRGERRGGGRRGGESRDNSR